MGANVSHVNENHASPINKGRVIAFHSSSMWKLQLEASKHTAKLFVVEFAAPWSGPCQHVQHAVSELAEKYTDVEFIKIDVDDLKDVAQQFGVQSIPTFILIKRGEKIDEVVGDKKDELHKSIEKHRY